MKITNKHGLPEPIYKAICQKNYSGEGEERFASVTELLRPAHMERLRREHRDELEIDASELVQASLGTAFHAWLEKANEHESGVLTESRLSIDVGGRKIAGGFDYFNTITGELIDYKTTSVWSVTLGGEDRKAEWATQLNCYAEMLRQSGFDVKSLAVVIILRDWSAAKAGRESGYPPSAILKWDLPLWEPEKVIAWIKGQITKLTSDKVMHECSAIERWERDRHWAVMKKGRKTAVKRCQSPIEAEIIIKGMSEDSLPQPKEMKEHWYGLPAVISQPYYIEERPGTRVRCEDYCQVSQWCEGFQAYKKLKIAD